MKRSYTASEVSAHNREDDCWVIVAGRVFDVTEYLPKHPGGKQLVSRSAGQDVTKDFEAMFHSIRARKKLEELYIGDLAGGPQFLAPWANAGGGKLGSRAASAAPGAGRGPYGLGAPGSASAVLLPTKGRPVGLSPNTWTQLTLVATRSEGCYNFDGF
jgi:predicted heme/steroid binding protein